MKDNYINYENSLNELQMESLLERRCKLAMNMALNCQQNEKTKQFFVEKKVVHPMKTRNREKYEVTHANRERLKKSSFPYFQALLNAKEKQNNY